MTTADALPGGSEALAGEAPAQKPTLTTQFGDGRVPTERCAHPTTHAKTLTCSHLLPPDDEPPTDVPPQTLVK